MLYIVNSLLFYITDKCASKPQMIFVWVFSGAYLFIQWFFLVVLEFMWNYSGASLYFQWKTVGLNLSLLAMLLLNVWKKLYFMTNYWRRKFQNPRSFQGLGLPTGNSNCNINFAMTHTKIGKMRNTHYCQKA